jgi:hypothetical protein
LTLVWAHVLAAYAGPVAYQGPALNGEGVRVAVVAGPPDPCLTAFLDRAQVAEVLWLGDAWLGLGRRRFEQWLAARPERAWLVPGQAEHRADRRRRRWGGAGEGSPSSWSRTTWEVEGRQLAVAALDVYLRGARALEQEYWSGVGLREDGAELLVAVAGPVPGWLKTDQRPFGTQTHLATRLVLQREALGVTLPEGPWGSLVVDLGGPGSPRWSAVLALEPDHLSAEAWSCEAQLGAWREAGEGWALVSPPPEEGEPPAP